MALVKDSDGDMYKECNFDHIRAGEFVFIISTKMETPPQDWLEKFYAIQVTV